jgi:4-hydroxythreonine-4-phosphate dehydrogenase
MPKLKIAITAGDVNGIGPEIIATTLQSERFKGEAEFTVFGPSAILQTAMDKGLAEIIECGAEVAHQPGKVSADAGEAAYLALEIATSSVLRGIFHALVTAPLSKEAMNLAGFRYNGHTEMLKEWCRVKDVVMMFLCETIIVGLLTAHIPLSEIPKAITKENSLNKIRIFHWELRHRLGILNPHLALCGLNPHAGENGLIGREEIEVLIPAAEACRIEGIDITNPLPADSLFKKSSEYDAIMAVYHDQGLIPAKLQKGGSVNYTGGLPIIRTSPDHGTAFNIAGKGIADPSGMINAIEWAIRLCRKRVID